MAGSKVYMAETKVHVFDFSCVAQCWVVMAGPKVYMTEPKVHVFDFSCLA
jgi:hypothetical protein